MSTWFPLALSLSLTPVASMATSTATPATEGFTYAETSDPIRSEEHFVAVAGGAGALEGAARAAAAAGRSAGTVNRAASTAGKAAAASKAASSAARAASSASKAAGAASSASRAAGAAAGASRAVGNVKPPTSYHPPAARTPGSVKGKSGASAQRSSGAGGVAVPTYQPPPPPGGTNSAAVHVNGGVTVNAPPPPGGVHPPAPGPRGPYYTPTPGPRVYVYPRVYTGVWSWWWWNPYPQYHYNENYGPSDRVGNEAHRERRETLHVGDSSFGVAAGVNHGEYANGEAYADPGLSFTMRYRSDKHTGMELSTGIYSTRLYPAEEQNSHRTDLPVQVSATFHAFPRSPIQLYGLVGVTADFRDFQKVEFYDSGLSYQDERFQDFRLGPHVGVGMELHVAPEVSLHGDIRSTNFIFVSPQSLEQTYAGNTSANLGLSFFF